MTVSELQQRLGELPADLRVYVMDDTDSLCEVQKASVVTAYDEGYGPQPDKPLRATRQSRWCAWGPAASGGLKRRRTTMTDRKLTREEILALPAGAALDALVAEKVMGLEYGPDYVEGLGPVEGWADADGNGVDLPAYSTDIAAAWQVVEKVGGYYALYWMAPGSYGGRYGIQIHDDASHVTADAAPHAICLAALLATL